MCRCRFPMVISPSDSIVQHLSPQGIAEPVHKKLSMWRVRSLEHKKDYCLTTFGCCEVSRDLSPLDPRPTSAPNCICPRACNTISFGLQCCNTSMFSSLELRSKSFVSDPCEQCTDARPECLYGNAFSIIHLGGRSTRRTCWVDHTFPSPPPLPPCFSVYPCDIS